MRHDDGGPFPNLVAKASIWMEKLHELKEFNGDTGMLREQDNNTKKGGDEIKG